MVDSPDSTLDGFVAFGKNVWQAFVVPVGIAAWAVYKDFIVRREKRVAEGQSVQQRREAEQEKRELELNTRHREYVQRIEGDFQEMRKRLQEAESEVVALRRENWRTEVRVQAWRHACRDAQQIVWALQRRGCPAGSDLTQFEPVEPTN